MNKKQLFILLSTGLAVGAFLYYRKPIINNVVTVARDIRKKIWDTIPAKAGPYLPLLQKAETNYQLPATLLTRMAYIESSFNPAAFNTSSGATGILQIVPKWHPNVDAKDPNAAIPYAAKFLRDLYAQFGTWEKAVAAYNWGPGNLSKSLAAWGDDWKNHLPTETRNYVNKVTDVIDLG